MQEGPQRAKAGAGILFKLFMKLIQVPISPQITHI
jgi:hypothetical protein